MLPPLRDAVLLGVLQGATEFLPVSSDGHLALAELLFRLEDTGLAFNVLLHAGTLVATLIVFFRPLARAVAESAPALVSPSRLVATVGGRDAATVILASVPTAAIGLALRGPVEAWTRSPLVLGLGFALTSLVLVSTRWLTPGQKQHPSWAGALAVGLAQGLAVLPGLSRSASTITSALWLGVRPDRAFELSFLMSLPAVAGALVLEGRHAFDGPFPLASGAVGAATALVTGVLALVSLRYVMLRGRFAMFALWTLPLTFATLALAAAWPR
jgi:undecaprenyl-diphosphatase